MIDAVKLARYIKFEGKANHLYLDGVKNVTYGIGCLIPTANAAAALNFKYKSNGTAAIYSSIVDEYNKIALMMPNQVLSYYGDVTTLYTEEEDIYNLFEFRLINLRMALQRQLPFFMGLPPFIQDVVEDMGYNLGVTRLLIKFPNFCLALQKKLYTTAAQECHRVGLSEERNDWAKDTLLGHFNV